MTSISSHGVYNIHDPATAYLNSPKLQSLWPPASRLFIWRNVMVIRVSKLKGRGVAWETVSVNKHLPEKRAYMLSLSSHDFLVLWKDKQSNQSLSHYWKNCVRQGHGKKIHCFAETFPTLEAGGRSVFFFNNSVRKSPGNHKQECKSGGLVACAAVVACSTSNGEKRYSYCKRR